MSLTYSCRQQEMNTASPCTICSEYSHRAAKCPQLHDALKEGFFSGGGSGGGGHSHDDDDDEHTGTHVSANPIHP